MTASPTGRRRHLVGHAEGVAAGLTEQHPGRAVDGDGADRHGCSSEVAGDGFGMKLPSGPARHASVVRPSTPGCRSGAADAVGFSRAPTPDRRAARRERRARPPGRAPPPPGPSRRRPAHHRRRRHRAGAGRAARRGPGQGVRDRRRRRAGDLHRVPLHGAARHPRHHRHRRQGEDAVGHGASCWAARSSSRSSSPVCSRSGASMSEPQRPRPRSRIAGEPSRHRAPAHRTRLRPPARRRLRPPRARRDGPLDPADQRVLRPGARPVPPVGRSRRVIYLVATIGLARGDRRPCASRPSPCPSSCVGVLVVGTWSVGGPARPSPRRPSGRTSAQGYGYVPLVLPLVGLWWIRRTARASAASDAEVARSGD